MFLYVKVLGRGGSIVINSKYYKVMFFIRMEGVYVIVDICIYLIIRSIDKMGNNRKRGREEERNESKTPSRRRLCNDSFRA